MIGLYIAYLSTERQIYNHMACFAKEHKSSIFSILSHSPKNVIDFLRFYSLKAHLIMIACVMK